MSYSCRYAGDCRDHLLGAIVLVRLTASVLVTGVCCSRPLVSLRLSIERANREAHLACAALAKTYPLLKVRWPGVLSCCIIVYMSTSWIFPVPHFIRLTKACWLWIVILLLICRRSWRLLAGCICPCSSDSFCAGECSLLLQITYKSVSFD